MTGNGARGCINAAKPLQQLMEVNEHNNLRGQLLPAEGEGQHTGEQASSPSKTSCQTWLSSHLAGPYQAHSALS